jgi:hypothetical protein
MWQITAPTQTDLEALCLTSKAFHKAALPLLYKRVDIRLWSRYQTSRFLTYNRSHVRYTKELIAEDERIGEEVESVNAGPIVLPQIPAASQRDDHLHQILQMMPEHRLRLFRYCRALSAHR